MMAKTKATLAVVACVTALGLGGCANTPNMAAEVGQTQITSAEVDTATNALNEVGQRSAERLQTTATNLPKPVVLSVLMRGEAAEQVAQQRGITIDQAQLEGEFNKFADAPDLAASAPAKEVVMASLTTELVQAQMGQEEFDKALEQVHVTTNPRYGVRGLEQIQQNPVTGQLSIDDGSLSNLGATKPKI